MLLKNGYDKLVAKVNNIATSGFVLKTKYDIDKSDLEKQINDADKKIPDTSELVRKLDYNAKITEKEDKMPSINGLPTISPLTTVENKIPHASSFVKKNYDAKISEIEKTVTDYDHDKCITASEFNNLIAKTFAATLAQANLVTKIDFDTKLKSLNGKINSNKAKHLLVENELTKLQTFDLSYFRGKHYFEEDGTQY